MSIFNIIKSRVSIVDVVNEYTTLKKAGTYLRSRCPFHHEKTGSFTVSPHKEIYYCFGCHSGGDVISFIAKIENCSPLEAARFLAERYNIELPKDAFHNQPSAQSKQHHYDICKLFAQWAHKELKKSPAILDYIAKRGINTQQIDDFMIGFMPGGLAAVKQCISALQKEQVLFDDLLEAGLIVQGKAVHYSPFEDRILFPIVDHMGRVCGFGGRIYKPQDTRPKYYNSRENDFFSKGSILFGLNNAKKSIQESGSVFLVEGYTDCIAMVQHGYTNTVATLGTACTLNHLKLLARYANYVYMLYDSDTAGQQALIRLAQLCWQATMELKVVHLPQGQDPASYLAQDGSLKERIANAEDIFTFFIATLGKQFGGQPLGEKIERIRALIEAIRGITEPLKQDIILQQAARAFDMPFQALRDELDRHPPLSTDQTAPLAAVDDEPAVSGLEKRLFCAIMTNRSLIDGPGDHIIVDIMSSPLKEILKKALDQESLQTSFDSTTAFDTVDENYKNYVAKLLVAFDEPMDRSRYEQLKTQFQKQQWKQIIKSITTQLDHAQREGNEQEAQKLMAQYNALREKLVPAKNA